MLSCNLSTPEYIHAPREGCVLEELDTWLFSVAEEVIMESFPQVEVFSIL